MKRLSALISAAALAAAAPAFAAEGDGTYSPTAAKIGGALRFAGDSLVYDRGSGEFAVTGNVQAAAGPVRFFSGSVSLSRRDGNGVYDLGDGYLTTCTNDAGHLHWKVAGHLRYEQDRAVIVDNVVPYFMDAPVGWFPYWYYPLNTDYGFRAMPGYRSRWGAYLLTGYVYNIFGEEIQSPERFSLGGSTYADYRTKNGFALGQTVRWNLRRAGWGKLRLYNAWDRDWDRYRNHADDPSYHYANWGSKVDYRRYRIGLDHRAELTERDTLRVHASYLSDSYVLHDFFEEFERRESIPVNEASYEHRGLSWAAGAGVSGSVNEFYGGTRRMPEGWMDVAPQPLVPGLPEIALVESQARAGWLDRDPAKYLTDDPVYKYGPARWADYSAFRFDFANRLTSPFKAADVLSFTPRVSHRGTWYSDSGRLDDAQHASGNGIYRNTVDAGLTVSARATGDFDNGLRHVFEPYADFTWQNVQTHARGEGGRVYYFDNRDRSYDWLDQFGFDGRYLPYSWYGVRPGLRNTFFRTLKDGSRRRVLDVDAYAAVQFNRSHRDLDGRPFSPDSPNYGSYSHRAVTPGASARWRVDERSSLSARVEYDCQNDAVAYADVTWRQALSDSFSYYANYSGRDYRLWDYADTAIGAWNRSRENILSLGFTHVVADPVAWSPFIRYDCRRNEIDETGSWFEYRLDCLAFRLSVAHQSSFMRVDGSKRRDDLRVAFSVYVRAFGPSTALDLARY